MFRVSNLPELNDMIIALGGTFVPKLKKGMPVVLLLPATVQLGNLVYVAMTFQINYAQAGNMGKGATGK